MAKVSGSFLVVVVASDSHANHVIGVDASRRLIYDHQIRNALPHSQEVFDGACRGSTTCVGLAEIRLVVPNNNKKRTRVLDSQSGTWSVYKLIFNFLRLQNRSTSFLGRFEAGSQVSSDESKPAQRTRINQDPSSALA
jgi:hypothetical protein